MITAAQAIDRWHGMLIPLVTPFKNNGELDIELLKKNTRWCLDMGAKLGNSIFLVAGSGGDFTSMNIEERLACIKAVASINKGRVPMIAGAQSTDIRDCIAIAKLCADEGYDAIQISGHYYYDPRPGDIVAWLDKIGKHAKIGFAVYNHYYSGSHYDVPVDVMETLLQHPNAVGVKWAAQDINKFNEGLRLWVKRFAVVDNTLGVVDSHIRGVRAFVSHMPNYCPQFTWKLVEMVDAGKYGEALDFSEAVMIPYRRVVGSVMAQTAGEGVFVRPFMKAFGLDGGFSRLPSRDAAVTTEVSQGIAEVVSKLKAASK